MLFFAVKCTKKRCDERKLGNGEGEGGLQRWGRGGRNTWSAKLVWTQSRPWKKRDQGRARKVAPFLIWTTRKWVDSVGSCKGLSQRTPEAELRSRGTYLTYLSYSYRLPQTNATCPTAVLTTPHSELYLPSSIPGKSLPAVRRFGSLHLIRFRIGRNINGSAPAANRSTIQRCCGRR